jgi:hypothetical protein
MQSQEERMGSDRQAEKDSKTERRGKGERERMSRDREWGREEGEIEKGKRYIERTEEHQRGKIQRERG